MKSLVLLITFMCSLAYAKDCTPIDRDFHKYYGTTKDAPLIGIDASISASKADKLVCAMESCGSAGCECALYIKIDGCHTRVLEFRGSHKVLGEKKDGMSAIQVEKRGDAIAPATKKTYVWDKDRRRYVEDSQ